MKTKNHSLLHILWCKEIINFDHEIDDKFSKIGSKSQKVSYGVKHPFSTFELDQGFHQNSKVKKS